MVVLGLFAGNDVVDDSGVRIMQFVTPTDCAPGVLFSTLSTGAIALATAREQRLLVRLRGTPLPSWIHLGAYLAAAVVVATVSVTLMLTVEVFAYAVQLFARTAAATAVTVLTATVCSAAIGVAIAAATSSAGVAQSVGIGVAVVLSFVSGLFVIGDLPVWLDRAASVFPVRAFGAALRAQLDSGTDGMSTPGAIGTVDACRHSGGRTAVPPRPGAGTSRRSGVVPDAVPQDMPVVIAEQVGRPPVGAAARSPDRPHAHRGSTGSGLGVLRRRLSGGVVRVVRRTAR